MMFHAGITPSRRRIGTFIAIVVIVSAAVVLAVHALAGSWATGAAVGGISGAISTATYPLVFQRGP